jgi:flagellar L-ring protein FlgH
MRLDLIREIAFSALLAAPLWLAGCTHEVSELRTPTFDQQMPRPRMNYSSGSLWQANSTGLAEDIKARGIGDIITVLISEQASASKQASTGTKRSSSISAGVPKFFGLEKTDLGTWMDLANLINANFDSKYDGTGATSRQENLQATMSAKVVDVTPAGNLLIEGRRNVKVNNEDQIIVLTGTVRSRDVSADNTVSSALIADARINYSGKGVISDRQRPGWLTTVFDKFWPF